MQEQMHFGSLFQGRKEMLSMRIDAYNQVAQLYGIQKNLKTQKAQNAAGPRDQVSISQAGRDYQVAKSAVSEASDIREDKVIQLLKDIANVLGRTEEKMTVTRLITLLESQPDVQKKLTEARDRLLAAADRMNHLNDQNVALIKQAIELNEFDLTLFKSLRQAPETANYDKTACNTGSLLGSSGFDAMS